MMPVCWMLHPLVRLHWRQIDGEWLVHEGLCGATHMIDLLSAAVLTCLEARVPLTMTDLLDQLRTDLSMDATSDQVGATVRQLAALSLVMSVATPAAAMHAAA